MYSADDMGCVAHQVLDDFRRIIDRTRGTSPKKKMCALMPQWVNDSQMMIYLLQRHEDQSFTFNIRLIVQAVKDYVSVRYGHKPTRY